MKTPLKCDVFILMRIFNNYENPTFFDNLSKTLSFIVANRDRMKHNGAHSGRICLMAYDDSPQGEAYTGHVEKLIDLFSSYGFDTKDKTLDYTRLNEHKQSAYALFYLRKRFVTLTSGASGEAIAVILDQDDILNCEALPRIIETMPKDGIVLCPFEMGGHRYLNNVDVAQQKHNHFVRRLSRNSVNREDGDIVFAASMCWTKAYSKKSMRIYVETLERFLQDERTGWEDFFSEHTAYDDFIDYYILLRADIKIAATSYATHIYLKHPDSITSKPSVSDFLYHRTATLIALIDMTYHDSHKLIVPWKTLLFRHVAIKVMFIENILAKYRSDFDKGDIQMAIFSEKTHSGYFINKFIRLALGEKRDEEQKDELFRQEATSRGKNSKANITDLLSCPQFNAIDAYKDKYEAIDYAESRYLLQMAVDIERDILKPNWGGDKETEEELYSRYGIKETPNMRRYRAISWVAWLFTGLILPAVLISILQGHEWIHRLPFVNTLLATNPGVKAAMISLYGVIVTYLFKTKYDIRLLATEEQSQMKLYFSEFEDLIRHLEANLKVMIQIVKRMREGKLFRPATIHMINLAWPDTSFLFSDEFAKIIDKDRVDDFARLKVNLRNINNSSAWLADYVQKETDPERTIEAIEWEIARHFGYLVNFQYLKSNAFHFASQEELDKYINQNQVRNSLTALFMDYYSKEEDIENNLTERQKYVDRYIRMYYDDRRMKRNVMVY